MRTIVQKRQFRKDYKRISRLGRNTARLFEIIELLQAGRRLPENCRDHALAGNWKSFRECHLGGDWLLIYQKTGKLLVLVRTGSHSELFR
jgi:mRNA interferase YafQ